MGGIFPDKDDGAEMSERAALAKEKADREEKARQLMLKRLQSLRRRGGGVGGGAVPAQPDQQDLLGG
jgi:hypothetical protein